MRALRATTLVGGVLAIALVTTGCFGNAQEGLESADEVRAFAGQMQLQQAAAIAGNYFATNGTYVGFNAAQGKSYEPSIQWTDGGPAADGVMSVRGVTPTTVVLVTADEAGQIGCISQTSGTDSMGTQDAKTAAQCTGGW